jgi:hypothetical protein
MSNKRAESPSWRLLTAAALLLSGILLVCSRSDSVPLSISWVSTDRSSFEPEKGERVVIRYRLSVPTPVTVRIADPFGTLVRTISREKGTAGDQSVIWDGRDDTDNQVPPEAYFYTISASATVWFKSAEEVTYDLRDRKRGSSVPLRSVEWSPDSDRLSYVLSSPSRVRVVLGRKDTGWPLGILLDWEPRAAGRHMESLSDWDIDGIVGARGFAGISPAFQAFSLPDSVIIVKGSKPTTGATLNVKPTNVPHRLARGGSEPLIHQHALHPRERCYSPTIELSFLGAETVEGVVHLKEPTPLRIDISTDQPQRRLSPIPRPSVFLFVDEVLVERNLDAYVPYQWVLDPSRLGPGEHWVSVLLDWQEDHFGVRHVRVKAERNSVVIGNGSSIGAISQSGRNGAGRRQDGSDGLNSRRTRMGG